MDCIFKRLRTAGERTVYRCENCKREHASALPPEQIHRQCGKAPPIDHAAVLPEEDRKLLGDRLADMLAAIGIPPCGGCEQRKQWLNAAHQWIAGITSTPES